MEGSVFVSGKDLRRWRLVNDFIENRKSQVEIAEALGLRTQKHHCVVIVDDATSSLSPPGSQFGTGLRERFSAEAYLVKPGFS